MIEFIHHSPTAYAGVATPLGLLKYWGWRQCALVMHGATGTPPTNAHRFRRIPVRSYSYFLILLLLLLLILLPALRVRRTERMW